MITCKEDLIGTYISTKDSELVDRYLAECQKYGFKWFNGKDAKSKAYSGKFIGLNTDITLSIGDCSERYFLNKKCKRLTISDFKPTRTEYVKVTDSIFNLKSDFEKGEFYEKVIGYHKIDSEGYLAGAWSDGNLYRKVEREITWQDEIQRLYPIMITAGVVSGKRLLAESEFIEMCHKVYHLTK